MSGKGIYDIHCHIVPGVDDGATDIEETGIFSFFLLRCNFVARVDCHAHADQRAASEILVSLHQLFAACVEASCHTGKCAE